MARNTAKSQSGQQDRLSVDVGPGALKKRKTKEASDIDANMKKKDTEFHAAMGLRGEPPVYASQAVWNNYLSAKMAWLEGKAEERNAWTQLDSLNAEMDKMSRQPFRLVGENDESELIENGYKPGTAHKKLRQRKVLETTSTVPAASSQKKSRETSAQAAPQKTTKATASSKTKGVKETVESSHSSPSCSSSTMSQEESDKAPSQGSAKKRRLIMELASSFVGGAWDANVDELGNRPRRSGSK